MKYNERIIKHNIDVPKLVPNGKINLTKIHYDKSVISHHPKSFEYYMIHGIVIDDIRYVVKEFFVRDNSVFAVVTPDENEYYEVVISNANSDEIDKLKKLIDDLAKSKANQDIDLNLNDRTLTVGDKSVTLPTDLQQLSLRGNKLSISGGNSVTLPEYDDSSVKSRIEDLENRVDKDNQELSIVDDKLSIKNGNTVTLPKFNQDLNLSGRTLSISGGNSVTLPDDKDTVYDDSKLVKRITDLENKRDEDTVYDDSDVKRRISTLENKTDNFVSGVGVSRTENKVKLTYTFVDGTNKEVEFEDNDTKTLAYDDTALKSRVKALEDKPEPTIKPSPVHRFYDGDIPGPSAPSTIRTVRKSNFANPDGIKVGDTVEELFYNSSTFDIGIWKVIEVTGDNVRVQGIINPSVNFGKNLEFNTNTRSLSIYGGNSVTIPSDKQTISKNGNKIVLSNGGGEVDIPTATPYDDSGILGRLAKLEGIKYKDKEEVIYPYLNGELLVISSEQRAGTNNYKTYTYKYNSSNKLLSEQFIRNYISFSFKVQEKNSITGQIDNISGNDFNITKIDRQFEELYNEQIYSLTQNTSLRIKLNTIWKSEDNKFVVELGITLIYKERDGEFVREYTHDLTNDEIDSKEQAHISIEVNDVEKGYCKVTISEILVGMSNFGYRVYKQSGGNTYTRLEKING